VNKLQTVMENLELATIDDLEVALLEEEQADCPVIHRFGPGVYIREVHAPAGTLAVGHHQNFEHMNIFLKGRVNVLDDDGVVKELVAPMMFVGPPGRKIGYITEDMVWLNVYATEETDVMKLEEYYLTKSAYSVQEKHSWENVDFKQVQDDHDDFFAAIEELGFTPEEVRKQSEREDNMMILPHGDYKIRVDASDIEGLGVHATADIDKGEVIAPARIGQKRTVVGRFTNHSVSPNAEMIKTMDDDIILVALRPLKGCKGGHNGEEITIDYRKAFILAVEEDKGSKICQL